MYTERKRIFPYQPFVRNITAKIWQSWRCCSSPTDGTCNQEHDAILLAFKANRFLFWIEFKLPVRTLTWSKMIVDVILRKIYFEKFSCRESSCCCYIPFFIINNLKYLIELPSQFSFEEEYLFVKWRWQNIYKKQTHLWCERCTMFTITYVEKEYNQLR